MEQGKLQAQRHQQLKGPVIILQNPANQIMLLSEKTPPKDETCFIFCPILSFLFLALVFGAEPPLGLAL